MRAIVHVASDVVRSAVKGRAMLFVLASILLFFWLLLSALDLEVVEGGLTAFRFFGAAEDENMWPRLGALLAGFVHGGVVLFGIVAGSGAAPNLLAPGRVEAMLALPISRASVVLGTYLGVLTLAASAGTIATVGIALTLWWKVGLLPTIPAVGALSALWSFAAIYSVMLFTATLIRSSALGVGIGFIFWWIASLSSAREVLLASIENAVVAQMLGLLIGPLPLLGHLASAASAVELNPAHRTDVLWAAAGTGVFSAAVLILAIWVVARKDY